MAGTTRKHLDAGGQSILFGRARGPGGWYRMAVSQFGLLNLRFPGTSENSFEAEMAQLLGRKPASDLKPRDPEELLELFRTLVSEWGEETAHHCHAFPPPLDLRGSPFRRKVWHALRTVPPGQLIAYGELAELAGSPRAARAVGTSMRQNPIPLFVPCHRVVASQGPGGFGVAMSMKFRLLKMEGLKLAGQ